MATISRRGNVRIPLRIMLKQYIQDTPADCISTDVGVSGIGVWRQMRPLEPWAREVGLEFELPGTSEVIWACGRIAFDHMTSTLQCTGIRFTTMANLHRSLLRDYVAEYRQRLLKHHAAAARQSFTPRVATRPWFPDPEELRRATRTC